MQYNHYLSLSIAFLLTTNRVPTPRFLTRRENFGNSRTFKADITLLIFA